VVMMIVLAMRLYITHCIEVIKEVRNG
jgi:hypothetical protein